jgi:hypothetical protein
MSVSGIPTNADVAFPTAGSVYRSFGDTSTGLIERMTAS